MRAVTPSYGRSGDLGNIGAVMASILDRYGDKSILHKDNMDLTSGSVYIDRCVSLGRRLLAASFSMCVNKVPLQVVLDDDEIKFIVNSAFVNMDLDGKDVNSRIDLDREHELKQFNIKSHPGARNKTNIWFTEVWEALKIDMPTMAQQFRIVAKYMCDFTNDQAACAILMGAALAPFYDEAAELVVKMIRNPDQCKYLTIILKGLGLNSTFLGAVVCEAQTLQGKGVGLVDMREECEKRTTRNAHVNTPQLFSDDVLRSSIRKVIESEIDLEKYRYVTPEEKWSSRWLWCKNGGHAAQLARHEKKWAINIDFRAHRKVAVENWEENPIYNWSGKGYASGSIKWEPGKSRLILSLDTATYVAFEHFLQPIEDCWRNKRILLNPGEGGTLGWCERVRSIRGGVNAMFDYDDFNSQHTLRAMEILYEELGSFVSYPADLLSKITQSVYNIRLFADGKDIGYCGSTLMSGHRGTTIVNSILNAAYFISAAPDLWDKYESFHTGDDVVANFKSFSDVEQVIDSMHAAGCRLNKVKQSIGLVSQEFLRMAIGKEFAIGYLCRGVVECVNGNWVNEDPLEAEDSVKTIIGCVRTVINRSGNINAARLCRISVRRFLRTKKANIVGLLTGQIALGEGPMYSMTSASWRGGTLSKKDLSEIVGDEVLKYKANATNDYLSEHAKLIERIALVGAGLSIKRMMVGASYAKSLPVLRDNVKLREVKIISDKVRVMYGSSWAEELISQKEDKGILTKYPLLNLIKNRLDNRLLRDLLKLLGRHIGRYESIKDVAWGAGSTGKIIKGIIPYADACACCKRMGGGIIYVKYNIYM